jgi:hypothetical protein
MKQLRLVALVLAATAWTAVVALACETNKGASAANAKGACAAHGTSATAASMNGSCTPAMASQCTAAMRAQCDKGAKGKKVRAASAAATADHCAGASATTASMDCCAGKGAASASAAAASGCAAHGARGAAMTKGAGSCAGAAGASAGMANCDMHGNCAVCLDEVMCSNDLRASGVRAQVVALRNGAMIVYTADNAENVRSLQTTVARFNAHIMSAYGGSGEAALCGECKSFRGAMASGKYSRELVNVKNGCQILLTSPDRSIVRKIHDMTGAQVAARVRT